MPGIWEYLWAASLRYLCEWFSNTFIIIAHFTLMLLDARMPDVNRIAKRFRCVESMKHSAIGTWRMLAVIKKGKGKIINND